MIDHALCGQGLIDGVVDSGEVQIDAHAREAFYISMRFVPVPAKRRPEPGQRTLVARRRPEFGKAPEVVHPANTGKGNPNPAAIYLHSRHARAPA